MYATLPFDHGCFGIHWSMMYLPSSALLWLKRSNSPLEQPDAAHRRVDRHVLTVEAIGDLAAVVVREHGYGIRARGR